MRGHTAEVIEAYLSRLVAEAEQCLGELLHGAYAGGSLALGAYEPGRSDVDVALVVTAPLSEPTKGELVERLRHESLPCPARGLELVVYTREIAATGARDPGFELELNSGAAMDFRATRRPEDRPAEDGAFWYAVDRSILREHGRTLLGPPAGEVFGEVEALRDVLADSVRWHLDRQRDDGVLAACRALVRVRTGRWVSKPEAARILQEDALGELTR